VQEILSLVDLTRESPFLPTGHPFTNVQADFYWSATTFGENPALAWVAALRTTSPNPARAFTDKTSSSTCGAFAVASLDQMFNDEPASGTTDPRDSGVQASAANTYLLDILRTGP
jgi:hypothetical protein